MAISFNKWFSLSLLSMFLFIKGNDGYIETKSPLWGVGGPHPFHISTTEINHNEKDKTLEISCRIFTDDFESALAKQFNTKADLSDEKMASAMDSLVKKYLLSHLQVKADNKPAAISYLGFEKESEAVYVYLQANNIASVKKIEVINSVLYDLFDDQASIIHVKVAGNRKSTKLDYPDKIAVFNW